jgi:hypothetical protein
MRGDPHPALLLTSVRRLLGFAEEPAPGFKPEPCEANFAKSGFSPRLRWNF